MRVRTRVCVRVCVCVCAYARVHVPGRLPCCSHRTLGLELGMGRQVGLWAEWV